MSNQQYYNYPYPSAQLTNNLPPSWSPLNFMHCFKWHPFQHLKHFLITQLDQLMAENGLLGIGIFFECNVFSTVRSSNFHLFWSYMWCKANNAMIMSAIWEEINNQIINAFKQKEAKPKQKIEEHISWLAHAVKGKSRPFDSRMGQMISN